MIEVKNLKLQIKGVEKTILDGISFHLKKNDFIMLLGGNGSGKSSLIKCLDGTYQHLFHGSIRYDFDTRLSGHNLLTMTQDPRLSLFEDLTLKENFLLWKNRPHAREVQREMKDWLQEFNPKLVHKLDQKVKRLSGGEKQAFILSLCLYSPPQVLFLDEHTSALDPKSAEKLLELTWKKIEEYNLTCVMTTHNLDDALRYGNGVIALKEGRVVFERRGHEAKKNLNREELLHSCY